MLYYHCIFKLTVSGLLAEDRFREDCGKMAGKLGRGIFYVFGVLALMALAISLIVGAFFSSMKTSNIYFLLNDAWKARLDVILLGTDIEEKSGFFSYDYLQSAEYVPLEEEYNIYQISSYAHKITYGKLLVWPWQKVKTVRVNEAVLSIVGELDTTKISKADAMAHDMYNIPPWRDSVYDVRLVYVSGNWYISDITRVGDYLYEPVKTHELTQEELEALRTPAPTPTPTPVPGEPTPEGERNAIITSALMGDKINLREGPNTAYKVLAKMERGDHVMVLEESDGWYLVRTDAGVEGYVSGYYISFE